MADAREVDKSVTWLLPFYTQLSELNASILNTGFRKSLRLLAAQYRLQYRQDNVGNIYIDSQGRDPELPPIGLCFPLDSSLSPEAFEGALRVFLVLQSRNLICGISLIGWSSPNGKLLGREVWEGRLSAEALYSTCPDIRQFTTMTNVDQFSLSALFEIVKSQRDAIAIQGSPVLVQKTTEVANEAAISKTTVLSPSRAPDVRIDGNLAVPLAISTVELYSKYVQALFDNFD